MHNIEPNEYPKFSSEGFRFEGPDLAFLSVLKTLGAI